MDRETFIIHIFCLVEDFFAALTRGKTLRKRGPKPAISDAEVIAIQVAGEFFGEDGDKDIWEYFKLNWSEFFPGLGDRTTFVKQAGNLWYWLQRLHKVIAGELGGNSDIQHTTDGFPVPVCKFTRAYSSKIFKGTAAYGYCAAKDEKYYGFKGHIVINSIGVISHFTFAAANVDERDVLPENIDNIYGLMLGDKGLIRPELSNELKEAGIKLEHPVRRNMKETRSRKYLKKLNDTRRLVETVIGQLSDRFNIEKVRARNTYRLNLRLMRKILAHTIGIFLNRKLDRPLLQFEGLVA